MTNKLFRLTGLESKSKNSNYIGFVLDALNEYLGLGIKQYSLRGCGALSQRINGWMEDEKKNRIIIKRVRENFYLIEGFPEEADFLDFREKAQEILERLVNGNSKNL